ncbi:MAG: glycosyltransferase family 4 protein, partial [Bacteroidota bacterium]
PAPFRLYPPKGPLLSGSGGDVLVVSHDLSLTGAPINLFDACKVMTDNGYFVVVCSPTDGPMRLRYQAAGIPVIVDALLLNQHESFYRFAKNFDRLFCNTIVTWPIVRQMKDAIDTIWWVQEARIIEQFVIDPDCEQTLREAPTLAVLSDYSLRFIRRYNPRATKIYNSCVDITGQIPVSILKPIRKRVVFSIIGSLEERKGQDILIDALSYLNAAELDKIEVRLIGRPHNPYFVKDLKDKAGNKEYIRILGELSREECIRQIMDCDVMVSASRDEPFSLVAAEAFCLSKPCIISENTGIAELITDGVNGYIFKHEDPRHLALKLRAVLDHHSRLAEIGQAARKTYDEHLTIKIFGKKILDVLRPI